MDRAHRFLPRSVGRFKSGPCRFTYRRGVIELPACSKCGRPLRSSESLAAGMGPVCRGKASAAVRATAGQMQMGFAKLPPHPDDDIVCRRDDTGPAFSIPQLIVEHSPTGMEWGYGGSGPADFALNILARFTDRETAYVLHQEFKREFIVPLPREGGTIRARDIRAWLHRRTEGGRVQSESA